MTRGQWTNVRIRVHLAQRGSYGVSINGDAFQTLECDTTKSSIYGPGGTMGGTWGLYGTATTDVNGQPMKDSIAQHHNIFLIKES